MIVYKRLLLLLLSLLLSYNCLKYLKPYDHVEIICINDKYLKL